MDSDTWKLRAFWTGTAFCDENLEECFVTRSKKRKKGRRKEDDSSSWEPSRKVEESVEIGAKSKRSFRFKKNISCTSSSASKRAKTNHAEERIELRARLDAPRRGFLA